MHSSHFSCCASHIGQDAASTWGPGSKVMCNRRISWDLTWCMQIFYRCNYRKVLFSCKGRGLTDGCCLGWRKVLGSPCLDRTVSTGQLWSSMEGCPFCVCR